MKLEKMKLDKMELEKMTLENTILYTREFCPYCVRVRTVMDELDVDIEIRDLNDDNIYREELIAGGGKQQVPCLYFKNEDEWMYESADIIDYIRDQISSNKK